MLCFDHLKNTEHLRKHCIREIQIEICTFFSVFFNKILLKENNYHALGRIYITRKVHQL